MIEQILEIIIRSVTTIYNYEKAPSTYSDSFLFL